MTTNGIHLLIPASLSNRSGPPQFRYLDEQAYRYNERRGKDGDRFFRAINKIFGMRLTYNQLRGKTKRGPKRRASRAEPGPRLTRCAGYDRVRGFPLREAH